MGGLRGEGVGEGGKLEDRSWKLEGGRRGGGGRGGENAECGNSECVSFPTNGGGVWWRFWSRALGRVWRDLVTGGDCLFVEGLEERMSRFFIFSPADHLGVIIRFVDSFPKFITNVKLRHSHY